MQNIPTGAHDIPTSPGAYSILLPRTSPVSSAAAKEQVKESKEARVDHEAKKSNSFFSFFSNLFRKNTSQSHVAQSPPPLQSNRFHYIKSGKAKAVHIVKDEKASEEVKASVYYTPVRGIFEKIFGRKKAEIQEEVKTAADVKQALADKGLGTKESYIATDLREIKGTGNLQGQYVVQAPKAGEDGRKIDLDELLRPEERSEAPPQAKRPLENSFDLGQQILTGLTNLHAAGYVHGDLKGDNILHFREPQPTGEVRSVLRIADFGKSRKVEGDNSILHTGNPRFAAPEGRTSKKAEVFSAALLLVRVLEENVLEAGQDMVVQPDKVKSDQSGNNLRGIIKFVVINDNCVQTDSKNVAGKIRLIKGAARAIRDVRGEKEKSSSEEVRKYISALFEKFKEKENNNLDANVKANKLAALGQMEKLLLSMVDENPAKRPDMSVALKEYEVAVQAYEKEPLLGSALAEAKDSAPKAQEFPEMKTPP